MSGLTIEQWPIGRPKPHPRNARTHSDHQIEQIAGSIKEFGFVNPILVDGTDEIVAGHGRLEGARAAGLATVPVIQLHGLTEAQIAALRIADNRIAQNAGWNDELLRAELGMLKALDFDIAKLGFELPELQAIMEPEALAAAAQQDAHTTLASRFGAPPFSVLDARQGWWQDRKRAWIALGIKSELGRGDVQGSLASARALQKRSAPNNQAAAIPAGFNDYRARQGAKPKTTGPEGLEGWVTSSIFDPVLCELIYRWFSPPDGHVLDPFAGGSVRGIVAGRLGRSYDGIDLRPEQIVANEEQARNIFGTAATGLGVVNWHQGDSAEVLAADGLVLPKVDLVFSCPPYASLEVYSDDPKDLSTMPYSKFLAAYRKIIANACERLADNRFAVFVVGEVRGQDGQYRGFVPDTINAFERAGLDYYNEAILVTQVGSLPVRTARTFEATRKLGKTHQNVLVFVKGDPRKASQACGMAEYREPLPDETEGGGGGESEDPEPRATISDPDALTPIELHGGILCKRDDLFETGGVAGGKVRTCWLLAQGAKGLTTAGSRASPQVNIVAHVARALGIPARVHTPQGALSPEVQAAKDIGAEVIQHKAGYNSLIIARARADANMRPGWVEIPFGMECREAVERTAPQVANVVAAWRNRQFRRLVVPVGSGMSLAGILTGLKAHDVTPGQMLILAVQVGADPTRRLAKFFPGWAAWLTLIATGTDYHAAAPRTRLGGLQLDPIYEAKCLPVLEPGDLFWVVGIRQTATS